MRKAGKIVLITVPLLGIAACIVAGGLFIYRLMPTEFVTLDEYLRGHGDVVLGAVTVSEDVTEIALAEGKTVVTIPVDGGRAEVPEGTWKIYHWKSAKTAEDGTAWEATCGYFEGQGALVEVRAGGEVALKVGEPFKAVLEVSRTGMQHTFTQRLEGARGEHVTLLRSGALPNPPRLHIENADESYFRTLDFEYG